MTKNKNQGKKSKHWCFTINNPTADDEPDKVSYTYIIVGKEICPETGTPHNQGYVVFKNQKYMTGAKKIFPRAHLEIKKGTIKEAIDYCKKDGEFYEEGEVPKSAKDATIDRWEKAKDAALRGCFEEIPAQMLMQCYHAFKRYHQDNPTKPDNLKKRDNFWIVAPSGYGKSTYVRERWPDFYDKGPNKWWVGYKDEPVVICDDFGPKQCQYLIWYMKRWADRFSFPMETKGGGKQIRPSHIVVTSQYEIYECFEDPKEAEAIENRFQVIHLEHWETRTETPFSKSKKRKREEEPDEPPRKRSKIQESQEALYTLPDM